MSFVLDQKSLHDDPCLIGNALRLITEDADFLRASYPHFDKWLACKVLPGLFAGERTLLFEERDAVVVGLLILKHTDNEKKLCTLRVRPNFESKGLGIRLFQAAFEILETERPLLSVSETSLPKFERLFDHFGFAKEAVYEECYMPRVDEFSYNGLLDSSKTWSVLAAPLTCQGGAGPLQIEGMEVIPAARASRALPPTAIRKSGNAASRLRLPVAQDSATEAVPVANVSQLFLPK